MKKLLSSGFTAVCAVMFALAFSGCDTSGGDDGGDPTPASGTYNGVDDLVRLGDIPTGAAYTVVMGSDVNISDRWGDINAAVLSAKKYVILDLSACAVTGGTISGSATPSGNDFNIIQNNPYIERIILPSALTAIGDHAFRGCKYLPGVSIPDSIGSIGSYAFYNCVLLDDVVMPSGLNSIGDYVFFTCRSLTSIVLPGAVASIGQRAFSSCVRLSSIGIPASVTSIGDLAFNSCGSLTSVSIPGAATIGNSAFSGCASLASLDMPGVTSIGDSAFSYCPITGGIVIPPATTAVSARAFAYCPDITQVTFSARSYGLSLAANAFSNCTILATVVFEDTNVTIANANSFPYTSTSLKAAYEGNGAGTYTLGGGAWSKSSS